MQSLFERDCSSYDEEKARNAVKYNIEEFAPGLDDDKFIYDLVVGVIKHQDQLDDIIGKAAPDWPLDQIAVVDRNILRLGLYELLFGRRDEVPAKVAINEAIELAKTFGGENSGRFVNGVLGAVYKEMGEPGKNDAPTRKKRVEDVPYEKMPIERLGGAVIYHKAGAEIKLALVHDIFGYWTLSKGHLEEGEDLLGGTLRKIKEETNLDCNIAAELGANEYIASDPEKGKVRKQVNYYLAETQSPSDLKLNEEKKGLDKAEWFALAEIPDLKMYDDIVPIVTKAIQNLTK